MSNITTLGNVSEKVENLSNDCHDQLVPINDIRFNDLQSLSIRDQEHTLRPIAQRALAYRMGIPFQYLQKCPPELQARQMNYWFEKEKNDELFLRFDGEEVRAVFTPRYKPVDNMEILSRLFSLGYNTETRVQCHLDTDFMLINIPDGAKSFKVRDDQLTPGISISNSEVGLASLSISAFFLRLVCTNGLIAKTQVSASYRHVSRGILEEFPSTMKKVSLELEQQQVRFRISMESEVDDPFATVEKFNTQFQLGKDEKEAIAWAISLEYGETMFQIVNTYTRAAQFQGLSAESSFRLQKVAGNILNMIG